MSFWQICNSQVGDPPSPTCTVPGVPPDLILQNLVVLPSLSLPQDLVEVPWRERDHLYWATETEDAGKSNISVEESLV